MNWEAIGAVGEVGGAIAVVATLLYLSRQIRHNAESGYASTQSFLSAEFNRLHEVLIANADMVEILQKVVEGRDLDATESRRFSHFARLQLNQYIAIQTAHDHGSVDEVYFRTAKEDVRRVCAEWPGLKETFLELLANYSQRWEIFESVYEDGPR